MRWVLSSISPPSPSAATSPCPARAGPSPPDGKQIYMDGSRDVNAEASDPEIRVWDHETLRQTAVIQVTDQGQPAKNINELEWVKGQIFANVWMTPASPATTPKMAKSPAGSTSPASSPQQSRTLRRSQWHRVRRRKESLIRHWQTLAQTLRNRARQTACRPLNST
jgi:hypothetical protein